MITEDYCSYEVSKLLKEHGFVAKCHSYYTRTGMIFNHFNCHYFAEDEHAKVDFETQILRPTHQIAMKWLREKGYYIVIMKDVPKYEVYIQDLNDGGFNVLRSTHTFNTYEEAVEATLKDILENLL